MILVPWSLGSVVVWSVAPEMPKALTQTSNKHEKGIYPDAAKDPLNKQKKTGKTESVVMTLCSKNQRFRLRQFGGRSEQQILHMICSKQNDLPIPASSATPDVAITLSLSRNSYLV